MVDMKNASYPFLPSFLVRYPLRTDLALQEIEEPITIFYAENDQVLPVKRAIKLNQFLDGNDQHYMLKGQRHNGLFFNQEVRSKTPEILKRN
jgi:poly(3-hydroxyalkanoate) synthetase